MSVILHILLQNILPLFILIGLGFLLEKRFNLAIITLTKINFYIFVPAFTFVNLYQTAIGLDALKALAVTILILASNIVFSHLLARARRYDRSMTYAFQNAIMFYNSGNIGIALITLVFSSGQYMTGSETPYLQLALTIQVMVLVVQNISVNTLGFINAGRASMSWKQAAINVLKMPAIYMVPSALILKSVPFDITVLPVWPVLTYARNGLVPVALLTLGVQLAKSRFQLDNKDVHLAVFSRLVVGPLLAILFIWLFQLSGIVAQVLFISASVPTAINSALIAVEKKNHPNFATQVVILSTVLSSLTMTAVIYLAGILYPV